MRTTILRPWSPSLYLYRQARRGVLLEIRAQRQEMRTAPFPSLVRILIRGQQERLAKLREFLAQAEERDIELTGVGA